MSTNALNTWLPTTTVSQARMQLFQPTRKPKDLERTITTAWGTATIHGKIGQAHADFVEAVCKNAKDFTRTGDGLKVLVDPQTIRRSMDRGTREGRYSLSSIWALAKDLRETSLMINAPKLGVRVLAGIVDSVTEAPVKVVAKNGEERALWVVRFSTAFAQLLADDLALSYDPSGIAELKSGVAQAIARLVLTHAGHPNGGWQIDSLLRAVGAIGEGDGNATLRKKRFEVAGDAEGLSKLGIHLENGRVYKK